MDFHGSRVSATFLLPLKLLCQKLRQDKIRYAVVSLVCHFLPPLPSQNRTFDGELGTVVLRICEGKEQDKQSKVRV